MADFRKTGDYLWKKYNGAIQVVMNQDGTGFTVANKRFKKPTKNDLVYFESSPDYCIRDRDVGKPLSLPVNGFILAILLRRSKIIIIIECVYKNPRMYKNNSSSMSLDV